MWEGSWRDDAVVRDKQTGQFAVPGRVRQINHEGQYFKRVPGPHICEPSPQRTPFLFQAGTSKAGTDFGAKHAEAVFMGAQLPELVKASIDTLRATARDKFGRDPAHIKVFTGICVIVDETDEKARAKRDELLAYGDREGALALFGGWTGTDLSVYADDEDFRFVDKPAIRSMVHRWASTVPGSEGQRWTKATVAEFLLLGGMMPKVVGGPATVVDELERWADETGVDGFNLAHVTNPGSFEDIIDFVIPELRRRGRFRAGGAEKEGATAREVFLGQSRLLSDHPGHQFKWTADDEE